MPTIDTISIVSHIEKFHTLNREGRRYVGSHDHPSDGGRCFHVYEETNTFHCFSCHAGGGIVQFEKDRLNTDYAGAYASLAEQYGVSYNTTELASWKEKHAVQDRMLEIFKWYHSNLTPKVSDYLLDRGFTEATIQELMIGYAPVRSNLSIAFAASTDAELLETGLVLKTENGLRDLYKNRIIFPFWHNGRITYSIGRTLDPTEKRKYIKQLVNNNHPEVHAEAVQNILYGEDKITDNAEMLVAEGIVDAILLQQENPSRRVISPVTTSWSNEQIKRLAGRTGKVKNLTFIADSEENNAGEEGVLRTAQKLELAWGSIAKEKPHDFKWKEKKEEPILPKILIARLRRPPDSKKMDVADYIADGKQKELNYWIRSAKSVDYEWQRIHDEPKRFLGGIRGAFQPKLVADEIMLERNYFISTAGQLYRYNTGVYVKDDGFIEKWVNHKMNDDWTPTQSQSVKQRLIETHHTPTDAVNSTPDTLNLTNGLYNLHTQELSPHTPDFLSTQRIPVLAKIHDSEDTIKILNFMEEVVPKDAYQTVYEMSGYCLYPSNRYEKSFILYGEGANGKGTLMKLIRAMVGKENTSNTALSTITDSQFASAQLYGKLVNFDFDINMKTIEDSSMFKTLTSGDPISAQVKYGQPFDFENKATLIFSANEIPRSIDKHTGFYRRWIFIDMNTEIPAGLRNPSIIDELTTPKMLSAFFELSTAGLRTLLKNKVFTESESSQKLMDAHKVENDSTLAFCVERLETGEGQTTTAEIRTAYKEYCEEIGARPQGAVRLNKQIKNQFPEANQGRDSTRRYWEGITLT